jgi:hypothetical protein
LLASRSASGQIGQPLETCVQTYGPSVREVPAMIQGSDPKAHTFRRKDVDVTVHFKAGRAWHIAYSKPFLSDAEIAALRSENLPSGKWRRPLGDRIGNVTLWLSEDNSLVVSSLEVPDLMLVEVMVRACVETLGQQREQRIAEAQKAPAPRPPAAPSAPPGQ